MRIVLLGDGPWAADTLDHLVREDHDVPAVYLRTDPTDTSLEQRARDLEVPTRQPEDVNADDAVTALEALDPELLLSVSYDQIFGPAVRELAPGGLVNVHAGKLPEYRGRSILNWTLINGEDEIGITTHYADDGIDTGAILLQRTLPIAHEDDYGTLKAKVADAIPGIVVNTVHALETGKVDPTPQEEIDRPATYFPKRGPGDEWIDWRWSSERIYNKIRALAKPGPGARTCLDDQEIVLWEATWDPDWPDYRATPGAVVGREEGRGVYVKTGDSKVLLETIQEPESKPKIPEWSIGTRLGVDPNRDRIQERVGVDR